MAKTKKKQTSQIIILVAIFLAAAAIAAGTYMITNDSGTFTTLFTKAAKPKENVQIQTLFGEVNADLEYLDDSLQSIDNVDSITMPEIMEIQ